MMKIITTICSVLILAGSCCAQTQFDKLVDEILWELDQQMINNSETCLPLPNVTLGFDKKILFWHLKGDVITTGGSISNMTSIHRIGDVNPVETNDIIITATFGMSDLRLHFDQIRADFLFVHMEDGLDLQVSDNALGLNITFHFDDSGNCSVILNQAEVTSLGGFHTTLLPTGIWHDIEDFVITTVLDTFSFLIKRTLNEHVFSILNGVIQQLDLCSKLPI